MLQPATGFYIWASLGIFCTLACLAECERCLLEGVCKPVDCSACCSTIKNSAIGLQNTYPSFFSLDYGHGCQKKVPATENVGCVSELFSVLSTLHDSHSKGQCSRRGNPDIDRTFACFMNIEWPGHETFLPCVNNTDKIVLFPGQGYLLLKREVGFISQNIEIEKSSSSELSPPCLSISPKELDWGQNYIYYPSVAFLKLKNICDENMIKVYEPFSTNSQFYPFNYSEVVLGPGEAVSISFVFLPKWLGVSSAELVLQTSLGGFLVQAKGNVIESPHRLLPLVVLDVSSGEWLSRKLSLTNLFDEAIHLEEITALLSVIGNCDTLLDEAKCRKLNPQGFQEYSFSDANKGSNGKQLDPVVSAIRHLRKWLIGPHRTENILEATFSPYSEGRALGALSMKVLRPLEEEKETIMVPFKAVINNTVTWKHTVHPFSASIEAVGKCDESETTISVSVRNNESHMLKVVRITDITESKKLLKIKYMEGLLLFPGSVTQVALVTYDASDVNYDSVVEMAHASMRCGLQVLTNDSRSPSLEVPCHDIFGICPRRQSELLLHLPGIADRSYKTGSLSGIKSTSALTKTMGDTEVDEFVLQKWKDQRTMSDLYVLDDHELLFPLVQLDRYFAKSITVKNPSQRPVTVQLILNSGEAVNNCKLHNSHIPSPWPSNLIHRDSTIPSRYGFSMAENTVTEAFIHPYGTASLGPIVFHPSNRCEWKSSALIRNNLSGVEQLSLRGFGGLFSLVLLEGPELKQKLHFNMNLPSLNVSFHISTPSVEDTSSGCLKPLSKKLVALNAGDFDVKVERIGVSGAACGLDGFLVRNCKGFSLAPGESLDLEVSYQTDFSRHVIKRDLEFKLSTGMLVLPMKASIPFDMLNLCRKSIFWVQVKKCCIAMVLATVLMFLLFWLIMLQMAPSDSMDYLIKGDKRSIPVVRPKEKSSTLHLNQMNEKSVKVTKMGRLKPIQRDEAESVLTYVNARLRDLKQLPGTSFSPSLISKSIEIESSGKEAPPVTLTVRTRKDKRRRPRKRSGATSGLMAHLEVSSSQSGNSTPSSPLSPITTPSPKNTHCPSLGDRSVDAKANTFNTEPVVPVGVSQNCSNNLFYTQEQPFCPNSTVSRPMLSSSATFPGTGRSSLGPPCSYLSRLAISPDARAPGPKMKPQKSVQAEERTSLEGRFVYDIWGNHLSGIHLMGRSDGSFDMVSEFIKGHSGSFFVRDPQTLLTDSAPAPVIVSRSSEEG